MKTCYVCNQTKELDQFQKRSNSKDGYTGRCKICKQEYDRNYYKDNPQRAPKIRLAESAKRARTREWIGQYLKDNPCVDCGESDIVVLEFDHRDRSDKLANISAMVQSYSLESVKKEIAKCDVRCANCHKRVTAKQFGWWKLIGG